MSVKAVNDMLNGQVVVAVKPLGILVCAIMAWGQSKKVGGYYGPGYGRTIAMGLVLSSIGDINLELSESYPLAFKVGLVAFLLGHICYIKSFESKLLTWSAWPFYAFGVGILYVLLPGVEKDLRAPVVVYTLVILNMGHASVARIGSKRGSDLSQYLAAAGAIDFMISDSVLAINKFRYPFAGAKTVVMLTYFSAQILMALSAAMAERKRRD